MHERRVPQKEQKSRKSSYVARSRETANQVDCKKLWFVGQGEAYGVIVAQVEAATRSDAVNGISRHACLGVVR